MRLILQRVRSASVEVDGEVIATIGLGILVLTGIERSDDEDMAKRAAKKLAGLRIFSDADGKMNLDAKTVGAEILLVSQFTLAAGLGRGRRPSFERAAPSEVAEPLVDRLAAELRELDLVVETGSFGAYMQVSLINDGPVTFVLDF